MGRGAVLMLALAGARAAALAGEAPAPPPALGCAGCHGEGSDTLPALASLDPGEIESALLAFRAGERPATLMDRIARGLTPREIADLAQALGRRDAGTTGP